MPIQQRLTASLEAITAQRTQARADLTTARSSANSGRGRALRPGRQEAPVRRGCINPLDDPEGFRTRLLEIPTNARTRATKMGEVLDIGGLAETCADCAAGQGRSKTRR